METLKAIPLFQHLKPAEFKFLRSIEVISKRPRWIPAGDWPNTAMMAA